MTTKSVLCIVAGTVLLSACESEKSVSYQGYAEGEYILVAAPYGGSLERLSVARGQRIEAGAPLFALEQANEAAARRETEQRLRSAEARVLNLGGAQRTEQVRALEAAVTKAVSALDYSKVQFARNEKLLRDGFISPAALDTWRTAVERNEGDLQEARAQLAYARQSVGRPAELASARADAGAAQAVLAQAEWKLDQKSQKAPAGGFVQETFYVAGEWVPAGKPVVSLLPPENVKVRFFVPEAVVGNLKMGGPVRIHCDGCGDDIPATLSYVSSQAEFTPPVIYSRESRAKLVFLVEARPAAKDATRLKPGQPLDVVLQ
jgi:HlyD family secretion protein